MIKLIILKCISAVAWKVFHVAADITEWAEKKIDVEKEKYKPAKTWMWAIDILTFILIALSIAAIVYLSYNPKIQDQKPVEKKVEVVVKEKNDFEKMKLHYTWLNKEVYEFIVHESEKEEIDPILIMAIKQIESGNSCGNNWKCMTQIRGGDGEYGAMQVMGYHSPHNPEKLKEWKHNTKKGIAYFKGGLELGKGNVRVALRLYNQGHAGKWQDYKNWKYPARIMRKYKKVLTQNVMAVR